jgi:hypothetical protein
MKVPFRNGGKPVANRQEAQPIILGAGEARSAERLDFFDRRFNEDRLQALLFEHPELVPAAEFDLVFSDLIPVARELPTAAGPVDLLYVTPDGFIVLVETKLWRNPEARRKVVAQIIDYTKEMAGWSYDDLENAIRRSGFAPEGATLLGLAQERGEVLDESRFTDNVSRNLALGRFLLLIVGDGIREGVEKMADFLRQTPSLRFTLGLVELAIYRLDDEPDGALFVQPRIIARTREVTRAVVKLDVPDKLLKVEITLPPEPPPGATSGSITEEEFFKELAKNADEDVIQFARWVLDNAASHGLTIHWGKGGPLLRYIHEDSGEFFTLGQLGRRNQLRELTRFWERIQKLELDPGIWRNYFDDIAAPVTGASRVAFPMKGGQFETVAFGKNPGPNSWVPLDRLAPERERWFKAIDRAVEAVRSGMDARDGRE